MQVSCRQRKDNNESGQEVTRSLSTKHFCQIQARREESRDFLLWPLPTILFSPRKPALCQSWAEGLLVKSSLQRLVVLLRQENRPFRWQFQNSL